MTRQDADAIKPNVIRSGYTRRRRRGVDKRRSRRFREDPGARIVTSGTHEARAGRRGEAADALPSARRGVARANIGDGVARARGSGRHRDVSGGSARVGDDIYPRAHAIGSSMKRPNAVVRSRASASMRPLRRGSASHRSMARGGTPSPRRRGGAETRPIASTSPRARRTMTMRIG